MFIYISFIVFLLFIIYLFIPTIYYIPSKLNLYRILIIGGTHGNEPAGYYAIKEIYSEINKYNFPFEIVLIPNVNKFGLFFNLRNFFNHDLNREYGGSFSDPNNKSTNNHFINKIIEPIINSSNIIIDLHEGYSYNRINENSKGSTLSGKNIPSDLINSILKNLNNNIKRAEKKFYYLEYEPLPGTLREIIKEKQIYLLVETTGQNNIQPLYIRTEQMKNIIYTVINWLLIRSNITTFLNGRS